MTTLAPGTASPRPPVSAAPGRAGRQRPVARVALYGLLGASGLAACVGLAIVSGLWKPAPRYTQSATAAVQELVTDRRRYATQVIETKLRYTQVRTELRFGCVDLPPADARRVGDDRPERRLGFLDRKLLVWQWISDKGLAGGPVPAEYRSRQTYELWYPRTAVPVATYRWVDLPGLYYASLPAPSDGAGIGQSRRELAVSPWWLIGVGLVVPVGMAVRHRWRRWRVRPSEGVPARAAAA